MLQLGWYAIQTRPKRELVVRNSLISKGYEVFLPTFTSARGVARMLFPGYLFCHVAGEASERIVTSPGVKCLVHFGDTYLPVEDGEIENLRLIMSSDMLVYPSRYVPFGCRVRIKSGPLAGAVGLIKQGGERLIVSVTLLQRSIEIELAPDTDLVVTEQHNSPVKDLKERMALALCRETESPKVSLCR